LIASPTPDYGFDYNGARDNYVVDEEKSQVVRRIFRMVGAEGTSLNSVKKTFDREGVPTPRGSRYWGATFIKRVITDDVYRPHAFEEVKALVSPEVASRLVPTRDTACGGSTVAAGPRSRFLSSRPTAAGATCGAPRLSRSPERRG
jgi:hypothetical protein